MKQMLIPIEPMTRMDNLSVDSTTYKQTYENLGHHLGLHECGHGPR